MENFTFHNATKIIFGRDKIPEIVNEIPKDNKVMIIYGGGSVKRNGTLEKVRGSLKDHAIYEFGGVEANPHYETLMHAVALVKDKGVNFLLALGGGSVIDGTKFVAAAACYDGDAWDIVKSYGSVVKKALPVGCVLTIAATGSEMNNVAVVTRAETKDKLFFASPYVMPQFSVLEPELTFTLPQHQTANGVVDAFVHVLEQYVTFPVNAKVQDRLAEGLLNTLKEEGPKVLVNPTDFDARANIMWAATMALNGLLSTGTPADWASHLIGQEITGLYGLDHACTLAVMIPAIWKFNLADKKQKLAQYGERVWNIPASDTETMAIQAIDATVAFFETMGIKTRLSDYGLEEDSIPAVIDKLKEHGHVALGEHGNITPEKVEAVLKIAL